MASRLYEAVRNGQVDVATELIKKGLEDINAKCRNGCTPLHYAVDNDTGETIPKLLISAGADVNARDSTGKTPLHLAVCNGSINLLKVLIEAGADPSIRDYIGKSPLLIVVEMEDEDDYVPNNFFGHVSFTTMECDDSNRIEIVKFLIQSGADVNVSREGKPLLHFAIESKKKEIVELLVGAGADVSAKNSIGIAPLQIAVSQGSPDILKFLIESGADVTVTDADGNTLLHFAVHNQINLEFFNILIKASIDVNACNDTGVTALIVLIHSIPFQIKDSNKKEQLAEALKLIMRYTNINLSDENGQNNLTKFLENFTFIFDKKYFLNIILEHVAKLMAMDVQIDSSLLDHVAQKYTYFLQCSEELEKAKSISLEDCWVTFFDLLVRDEEELTKFAGNEDLIRDFEATDLKEKFPIFGSDMQSNVLSGLERRKSFDAASIVLSTHLPIFNSTHLIVNDVLCALSSDDWKKLCE